MRPSWQRRRRSPATCSTCAIDVTLTTAPRRVPPSPARARGAGRGDSSSSTSKASRATSSSPTTQMRPPVPPPALLTTTSIPPSDATASAASECGCPAAAQVHLKDRGRGATASCDLVRHLHEAFTSACGDRQPRALRGQLARQLPANPARCPRQQHAAVLNRDSQFGRLLLRAYQGLLWRLSRHAANAPGDGP